MLTTHLTDMLLQVEICLPFLIYSEKSTCISNQKLLKSLKAEAELCIWVYCLSERSLKIKIIVPRMWAAKIIVRIGLSSLTAQYYVGCVVYKIVTYLTQV